VRSYWHWTTSGPKWKLATGVSGVLLTLLVLVAAVNGGSSSPEDGGAQAGDSAVGVDAPAQTGGQPAVPQPTATRVSPSPTPKPEPIVLRGRGQHATQAVSPPGQISVATFTHTGRRNFIVYSHVGQRRELLVNKIGNYQGQRPILGADPVVFDIDADGDWTIILDVVPLVPTADIQGHGDFVSGIFNPPGNGAWEIQHAGTRNFIVKLHCASGTNLVQNVIGPVSGSRVLQFGRGPCFWEIEADGSWLLRPRA
jgi:hypothetical protein